MRKCSQPWNDPLRQAHHPSLSSMFPGGAAGAPGTRTFPNHPAGIQAPPAGANLGGVGGPGGLWAGNQGSMSMPNASNSMPAPPPGGGSFGQMGAPGASLGQMGAPGGSFGQTGAASSSVGSESVNFLARLCLSALRRLHLHILSCVNVLATLATDALSVHIDDRRRSRTHAHAYTHTLSCAESLQLLHSMRQSVQPAKLLHTMRRQKLLSDIDLQGTTRTRRAGAGGKMLWRGMRRRRLVGPGRSAVKGIASSVK